MRRGANRPAPLLSPRGSSTGLRPITLLAKKMRTLISATFALLVTPVIADIGASLESAREKYGAVAPIPGDAPSYAFRQGDAIVELVLTPTLVSRINVFYSKTPADKPEILLERFAGRPGWKVRAIDDPEFQRQFADYGVVTDEFYVAGEVYALVRRDFISSKLMLLIQTSDFPRYMAVHRKKKKG